MLIQRVRATSRKDDLRSLHFKRNTQFFKVLSQLTKVYYTSFWLIFGFGMTRLLSDLLTGLMKDI